MRKLIPLSLICTPKVSNLWGAYQLREDLLLLIYLHNKFIFLKLNTRKGEG